MSGRAHVPEVIHDFRHMRPAAARRYIALMQPRPTPTALIAAGLVTWAVMVTGWILSGGLAAPPLDVAAAVAAWATFAIAFTLVCASRVPESLDLPLILLQTASALVLAALGYGVFSGVLFAVVAGELAMKASPPVVGIWLVVQSTLAAALMAQHVDPRRAIFTMASYFGFQLFAAGSARLARREAEARDEVSLVHARLVATQAFLQNATRTAERLRISRELHDSVGHHLTALSLHLKVAKNTAPGNEAIVKSQQIAREMLGEVRNVVGALRDEPGLDLRQALATLVAGVPSPAVHFEIPASLEVTNEAVAHAAFRTVQEALTNAIRHARAQNLWVELHDGDGCLKVTVRDDGRGGGGDGVRHGHGLTGVRERILALGGVLEIDATPGRGLALHASIPMSQPQT